jgi:hypothetical protein
MKTTAIIIVGLLVAPILFFIGLRPAEGILTTGNPDSYILIGIGRGAIWVAGACEFILGTALAASVCMLIKNKTIQNQKVEHISKGSNTTL